MSLAGRIPGMRPGSRLRNVGIGLVYLIVIMAVVGAAGSPPADSGTNNSTPAAGSAATDTATDAPTETTPATETGTPAETETPAATETSTETETETETEQATETDASGGGLEVRVEYDGEWSGSIAADGESRSVDGSGAETFDIEGDPMSVSANAQKQDDSGDELTIQILRDGEVISESSTTAEYGVAQTSDSSF